MQSCFETWKYRDHIIASRLPRLDGWLLCGDFDPIDCEYEQQFIHYNELCSSSSIEEAEVMSAVCFGKPLHEVSMMYNAWRKCTLVFKYALSILDANIAHQQILDHDIHEYLNIVLVHLKFALSYSDVPLEILHSASSEDGISTYYDSKINMQICEVTLKSTEVCKQVLYRMIKIVNRVKTAYNSYSEGNTLWTRDLLKQ